MPTGIRHQDAMLRHQMMLERVKGYYYRDFNRYLKRLAKELQTALRGYGNLSDLTRRELAALTADINRRQGPVWDAFRKDILAAGQRLMRTDRKLAAAILAAAQPEGARVSAAAFLARARPEQTLWAFILAEPLGTGQTLEQMIKHFTDSASVRVANSVSFGYANNLDGPAVLDRITGGKLENAGLFRTLRNQSRAVIATSFQHISQESHSSVQSASYSKYRWVSVLDDRTTDICRGRHGKVFEYGKGPMPPAHFHCRSTIVPDAAPMTERERVGNADEWLAEQLAKTVTGMVGRHLQNTWDAINTAHMRPMSISALEDAVNIMTRD